MFRLTVAPGIEIRLFDVKEAEAIYAEVDRGRAYLRRWLPWVDFTRSPEDIRQFIVTRVRGQYEANQGPQAGIWIEGEFAGSVGCHPINWQNRNCSFGYWIAERHQGKGIVTRCCGALLTYLFEDLRLHRVVIECGTGNAKSCAIPQRLGFSREGISRHGEWVNDQWIDLVVWSMLEDEWRAGRSRTDDRVLSPVNPRRLESP
ncbi:MAG TPA: GNAT family protein [Candidatus Acidoferrales bacterium]|nr:GNAT family protein [Candidatus Acidoferrales bacterium]